MKCHSSLSSEKRLALEKIEALHECYGNIRDFVRRMLHSWLLGNFIQLVPFWNVDRPSYALKWAVGTKLDAKNYVGTAYDMVCVNWQKLHLLAYTLFIKKKNRPQISSWPLRVRLHSNNLNNFTYYLIRVQLYQSKEWNELNSELWSNCDVVQKRKEKKRTISLLGL